MALRRLTVSYTLFHGMIDGSNFPRRARSKIDIHVDQLESYAHDVPYDNARSHACKANLVHGCSFMGCTI